MDDIKQDKNNANCVETKKILACVLSAILNEINTDEELIKQTFDAHQTVSSSLPRSLEYLKAMSEAAAESNSKHNEESPC
ncbi:hypothetical protein CHUAL_007079 [Chamberlinius hualienensis]